MAISDVLLEGGLTFKIYLGRWGARVLKSEYFRGNLVYGWPPSLNVSDNSLKWLHDKDKYIYLELGS